MAIVNDTETMPRGERQKERSGFWHAPRYLAEVFDGADDVLTAIETIQDDVVTTGFQSLNWLTVLYEELATTHGGMPRLVVVSDRDTGEVALALPLIIKKIRRLRVASFADLGVMDYGAPQLGPAAPTKKRDIRRLWRSVRRALRDVDLIRLERMPQEIGNVPNPLIHCGRLTPAQQSGFVIDIPTTVDDFIASRGKKFRKEVQRCLRVWQRELAPRFFRATTPAEIARVFSILEDQQAARQAELGNTYVLDQPAYRAFYERLAMDGSAAGLGYLYAVEARGEIIATLFGIVHGDTFTMLRITFAGEPWSHVSPGRLIIVEAMRSLRERGITTFDLGMGDYDYKRRLGAREIELRDLIVARDLSALPRAIYQRLRGRLRQNRRLRSMFHRFRTIPAIR